MQKKQAVAHALDQRLCSEWRACLYLGLLDRPIGIRRKEGLKVRPKPNRIPRREHSSGLQVVKFGTWIPL